METAPTVLIRRGRKEDEPYIRAFTRNTFEWGDYVGDAFAGWLDGHHEVYVAEAGGVPVAVTCVAYPAEGEAWFQGIRVHPDYRRLGIARRLTEASIAGARARGAHVCRSNIDSDNVKSQGLAKSMGFRQVARIIDYVVSASETGEHAPQLAVERIEPGEAPSLLDLAAKDLNYLGSDYVWIALNAANLQRIAAESMMLAAIDSDNQPVAGAILGEFFEGDQEQGHKEGEAPHLDGSMGSFFGSEDGIRSLVSRAKSMLLAEAERRHMLPGKLFLYSESDSRALQVIRSLNSRTASELHVPDDVGLWELKLSV